MSFYRRNFRGRSAWLVKGALLKPHCCNSVLLDNNKVYNVCQNLIRYVTKRSVWIDLSSTNEVEVTPIVTRSIACTQREGEDVPTSFGRVIVRTGTRIISSIISREEEADPVSPYRPMSEDIGHVSKSSAHIGHREKTVDDFFTYKKKYRKRHSLLTFRQRQRRADVLAKDIISSCIDFKKLKEDGPLYLQNNKQLGQDISSLLNQIKWRIEKELCTKINEAGEEMTPAVEEEEENKETFAVSLLNETTIGGYTGLRQVLIRKFPSISKDNFPTHYHLTKMRPKVIGFLLHEINSTESMVSVNVEDSIELQELNIDVVIDEMTRNEQAVQVRIEGASDDPKRMLEKEFCDGKKKLEKNFSAKLEGGFARYLGMMREKLERIGVPVTTEKGVIGVIDSFDGAEHKNSEEGITSVTSFSSCVFSLDTCLNGLTTSQSVNILTWQQFIGKENAYNVLKTVRHHYEERQKLHDKLLSQSKDIRFYDLHDGKMLYLLTQHSLFNRKHRPFLLCSCGKGDGVRDTMHKCIQLDHDTQVDLYERSRWRFNKKQAKVGSDYTYKLHMDWVDNKNNGVSHFGLSPLVMPRHYIRFDLFHLRSSVTRKLIEVLRRFIRAQIVPIHTQFGVLIRAIWEDWYVLAFECNKAMTCLRGKQILSFIRAIPSIAKFLRQKFHCNEYLDNVIKSMELWQEISKFMHTICIFAKDDSTHDKDVKQKKYEEDICKFESNVKLLYHYGGKSFLTKTVIGDQENLYMHVLRYYMPIIVRDTWDVYNLGIGIFSMQGFEWRNKESKRTLNRFTNHRGNILQQNMVRLWDNFYFGNKLIVNTK